MEHTWDAKVKKEDWISVEDMLPEKSGYYLVATSGYYKSDRAHIEKYSKEDCLHWWGLRDVTHWMPLPALPEPGNQ